MPERDHVRLPRPVPARYYSSDSHESPSWGSDFVVEQEIPPREFDDFTVGMVVLEAGPRMRVVLEGRTELVQEIWREAMPKVREVAERLKAERA